MKKKTIMKKLCALSLTLALMLPFFPVTAVFAEELNTQGDAVSQQATTKDHSKQVIGYITQWDAWKDSNAGVSKGAFTHLNIDYSKYTILNYSFYGVAKDGSLHSGDYRNKNIYKEGEVQNPAPLFFTDVYSSWDFDIIFGEIDLVQYISADVAKRAKAQGFDVVENGNTWSNPSWNLYNQSLPMPLKKEGGAPGLLELAKKNGVKVNASIGGWSMCKHYSEVAADPVKRAKFIADCVRLVNMGFDGIDLDWEYPGPFGGMNFTGKEIDYANYLTLVREIKDAIGPDKLLTSCFAADTAKIDRFNWTEVDKYVDYYNFMTYDYNGGWSDHAGHNSPLYNYGGSEAPSFNWDSLYQYLAKTNIDMNKVNMGAAFYGRGVVTKGNAALNAETSKRNELIQPDGNIFTSADYTNWPKDVYDGTPFYSYIKKTALAPNSGWTKHWDDEAKVPYLTKGNFFLSYDDEESIGYKAQYIKDKNLAGVIVWTVYEDLEFGGTVTNYGTKLKKWSDVKSPLINKINDVFANGTTSVATPVFTPVEGKYEKAQNVTISCATPDAIIRYTTDGSEPTAKSTQYSGAINVAKTTTLKAKAFKVNMNNSATVTATYTIGSTPVESVATPVFNPAEGTYKTSVNVTLSSATAGATIRYTVDGSEPTAESAEYKDAINVSKTQTLKAKAFKENMKDSATATATYTITLAPIDTVATPTFSPAGGTFDKAQTVTISSATAGATIRYTTDGSEPNSNSTQYASAINVAKTTTLRAKAFKANMADSATATETYTISSSDGIDTGNPQGKPASPALSHNNWSNNADYNITFNIWWGTNATSYKLYENGTIIEAGSLNANSPNGQSHIFNLTNKAIGTYEYKISLSNSAGTTDSNIVSVRVVNGSVTPIENVATPAFSPEGGTYDAAQKVTISCATAGATIRYTTDGTDPTASSPSYSGAITVDKTTTVKAKAFKSGMGDSKVAAATYTISVTPVNKVATPKFSPAGGTYSEAQKVTISCATADATIRYTTDGSEPTASSALYNGAITVDKTVTVKAKAFKDAMTDSETASATYTIQKSPVGKAWAPYTQYAKGDIVSYNNKNYECLQPHLSLPGWEPSNVPALWKEYNGTVNPPVETVGTPSFNPTSGTYSSAQNVGISCSTTGASIYYTTDGTEPSKSSTLYNSAITVEKSTTLKAKAFKDGMTDSATATATYTITVAPIDTVVTPVFNPAGGTYSSAQKVKITTTTADAVIRYTTDGTEPTEASAQYSNEITVSKTTTVKAKAFKAGMTASTTATATYVIGTTPVVDLPAHILTGYWQNFDNGAKCLKISDVPTSYNLIAVAFADATTPQGSVNFTLDSTLSSKLGGYTKQEFIQDIANAKARGQKVIISVGGEVGNVSVRTEQEATNFANSVYSLMQEYGFDGVDIDLEHGISSTYMASALRQLSAKAGPSLIITMAPQTLDMQNVNTEYFKLALSIKDILTVINTQYYNSGAMLGYDGKVYSQGSVDFLTALATIQLENGLRPDQIGLGLPASPKGAGGGYMDPTMVNTALKCLANGEKGGSYVPPHTYPTFRGAMNWSINWDAANNYNFANTVRPVLDSLGTPITTVATPSFNPAGGTYSATQNVTISCATPSASIRYTLDGTEPTASSPLYTSPIQIATSSATTTLKAKAFKAGLKDSATASASYIITSPVSTVATPTFNPAGGTYSTAQNVTVSCATSGASIRYTLDGTEPTALSPLYAGSIAIASTKTLKAKAFKDGMNASATATATYTIGQVVPTTTKCVGYYPDWEPTKLDRVQFDVVTHINYSFAIPTAEGTIRPFENPETAKELIRQAHANGVKVLVAIGGWSYKGTPLEGTFIAATNTDAKIEQLATEIMKVVNEYGFDGVDMDWEHPRNGEPSQKQYEKLMLNLSGKLKPVNKLLTSAVLSGVNADGIVYWDSAAHTDAVLNAVDWINVMAYDGGDAERHSSYDFAVNCGNYWKNTRKMPASKVVLGVPFYGRPSWASYDEILTANPEAYKTDISMINGIQAHYNGIPTIQKKAAWAKANLGGIMIWELTQDTVIKEKSLLYAIGQALKNM